ncbi:MAG: hypothetical protein WC526_03050 [Patescibacteria group bacterium]
MRRNIDNIEIVEPPFEELTKKYSTFSAVKRTCLAGCGCLVIFIIGIIILLKVLMGAGPQNLSKVPANFPADIPVYDKDSIQRITYVSGNYKNKGIEIAAIFPKIILSPLLMSLENKQPASSTNSGGFSIGNLWQLLTAPISDHRDTVQIEWRSLAADPFFIVGYYKTELQKNNYNIDLESEGNDVRQFSFSRGDINGSLYVESGGGKAGTNDMILTVNIGSGVATGTPASAP